MSKINSGLYVKVLNSLKCNFKGVTFLTIARKHAFSIWKVAICHRKSPAFEFSIQFLDGLTQSACSFLESKYGNVKLLDSYNNYSEGSWETANTSLWSCSSCCSDILLYVVQCKLMVLFCTDAGHIHSFLSPAAYGLQENIHSTVNLEPWFTKTIKRWL